MATTPVKPPTPSVAQPHDNPSTRPNPLHGKPDPDKTPQVPPYGAPPYQPAREPRVYAPSREQTPAERAAAQAEANAEAEARAGERLAELDAADAPSSPWAGDQARAQASVRAEEQAKAHRHPVTNEIPDVFGMPPEPNMAPEEVLPANIPENTRAEMEAGRAALASNAGRTAAEQAEGRKVLSDKNHRNPNI